MAKNESTIAAEATRPTSEEAAEAPATAKTEKPDGAAAGFYCYIGPSITGLIQHGAIYMGTRKKAMTAAAAAIEKYPLIKTLIVSGEKLSDARRKVKTPGNALYKNYRRVAGKA